MGDNALARLRNKLEKAELDHLRQHCSDLAARLEMMEERAIQAESQSEWYWQQHTDLIRSLTEQGEEIGLTRDGQVGIIVKPSFSVPQLAAGETYVATLFDAQEGKGYHLILLPGDNNPADWKTQVAWAQSVGGELPTRVEHSLLFAKFKLLFQEEAYWSGTEHTDDGWAWSQGFSSGYQCYYRKLIQLRARAVRRLPI